MQQLTDPYRALGVSRGATEAEIKAAHRKLVKRYHPDTGSHSETERFLRVQEAYRVLSDPLLRKEWDMAHAPGPVRADRPPASPPRRRRPVPTPESEPSETAPPPRGSGPPRNADPRTQPRSSRAYTWSASEVPWWEEKAKQRPDQAETKTETQAEARADATADATADAQAAQPPPQPDGPTFNPQDFDVYNRSSGAAWSSAARAYFRKGEADLPRRGSFRHQGTQVVTAGRARSAAEAEARHRAAAAAFATSAEETFAGPQNVAAPGPHEGTTHVVRRAMAAPWPSLRVRLLLALIAWLPTAAYVGLTLTDSTDLAVAGALIAVSLLLLVAVPRVAYIAALATLLVLVVGGLFVGGLFLARVQPSVEGLSLFVGGMLLVGYLATAAVVVIGPTSLRPWSES